MRLVVRSAVHGRIGEVQDALELVLAGGGLHQLGRLFQVELEVLGVFAELIALGVEPELGLTYADKRVPVQLGVDAFFAHARHVPDRVGKDLSIDGHR